MLYKTPPIIEAVVEFRLSEPVRAAALERTKAILQKRLPSTVEEHNYNVHLDGDRGTVNVTSDPFGFRLQGKGSSAETVVLKRDLFSAAKLAPYSGWEDLRELAKECWAVFLETAEPRGNVARVGLRYVNRVDIPWSPGGRMDVRDYLTFVFEAPQPPLRPSLEFLVSMETDIGDTDECGVRIVSSSAASPLIGHNGIVLDIDVFTRQAQSMDASSLWTTVERMRKYKNDVFETCITDKARDLFGRA